MSGKHLARGVTTGAGARAAWTNTRRNAGAHRKAACVGGWLNNAHRLVTMAVILGISNARAEGERLRFDIKAGAFFQAIFEFSHQAHIEIGYSPTPDYEQIRTHAVKGELEPQKALEQMLLGTGLNYAFDTDHSVVITKQGVGPTPGPEGPPLATATPLPYDSARLAEVVVTGSLLHGVLDVMAPLITISNNGRDAGYATVQDALYALPIDSLNAPREDLGNGSNINRGAAINLRGLGVGATLVLVNGQRQPLSGFDADFVDVSNIPWTAVERVEVLPDGASALYGSDAIAGVINIILRDNVEGAQTQVRFGRAIGGANEKLVSQIFGTRWDTGRAMLGYQYSERTSLDASERAYAADADKRPFGGADYRGYYNDPANILSPLTVAPIYRLSSGGWSTPINFENPFAQYQIFPQRRSQHVFATLSQRIGDPIELFAEGRFAQRDTRFKAWPSDEILALPPTNPYSVDPTGSPYTQVAYSFLKDFGPNDNSGETRSYVGTIGAKFRIGGGWRATLSGTLGQESLHVRTANVPNLTALQMALATPDPAMAFNPFGATKPATLSFIRQTVLQNADSGIQSTNFAADGPVLDMPGGAAQLAVGTERRKESLSRWTTSDNSGAFWRTVNSVFAELSIPVLGSRQHPRAAPRVELDLAGRYEDYSDFGHTFNPQMRLRWIPLTTLKLRASWGTSFRAPKLVDLYDSTNNASGPALLPDPRANAGGQAPVLGIFGNNQNLKQETARTWTAGLDWVPETIPGFNFSLTGYGIDYDNRVVEPGPPNKFDVLLQESVWAPIITRNPTQAQIDAVCLRPDYQSARSDCLASSPVAIIDFRPANLATTNMSGLDLQALQTIDSRFGHFQLGLTGAYIFHFNQAATSTSPESDILDVAGSPLAVRLRSTVEWSQHPPDLSGLRVNGSVNHTGSYRNPDSASLPRVAAWTTFDLQVAYRTSTQSAWLRNMDVALNVVNVFDRAPPFVDNPFGYDVVNAQPLGRVLNVSIRKNW